MEKKLFDSTPKEPATPADAGLPGLDASRGGIRPPANADALTSEQAAEMRRSDPQKYARLAQSGKLKIVD